MRRWIAIGVLAVATATAALAQDAQITRLDTTQQGRGWEAVGRLDIGGAGFCTGALIAENLVLTAAHCLYDPDTGARINPGSIRFLAGWRNGRASAYRDVRRAVTHPDYDYDGEVSAFRVRHDVALLELQRPIRNGTIQPFDVQSGPVAGDRVGVVSYARERSEAPSLQEVCEVLGENEGVLVTSCTVDFGSSGAPILTFRDGQAFIVSVVSAKAQSNGKRVSLGTALLGPLQALRAELAAGGGLLASVAGVRGVRAGERADAGAKFVKP